MKTDSKSGKWHSFGTVLFFLVLLCGCQNEDSKDAIKRGPGFLAKIYSDSLLEVSLSFNIGELMQNRDNEEKINGKLLLFDELIPVKLASRGITRKKICTFPPIHLHLPDSLTYEWGPYKKYKIVTECNQEKTASELVLKEYLVYKLYRILTSYAFEVQLSRINYQTENTNFSRFAFFIEDDDEMASRVGGRNLKKGKSVIQQIQKESYQTMVLFQYMIGNTDWNLFQRHNVKFVQIDEEALPIPVPYDFDYCGLVNAPYAVPYPSLPIRSVRERLWQYRGQPTDDLSTVVNKFLEKKSQMLNMVNDFYWLTGASREEVSAYLHSFFDLIEQNGSIRKIMDKGG